MIKHWLCVARNKDTPDPAFRQALAEIGRLLMYECTRDWLDTVDFKVEIDRLAMRLMNNAEFMRQRAGGSPSPSSAAARSPPPPADCCGSHTLISLKQIPGYVEATKDQKQGGKQQRCCWCNQPTSWACKECSSGPHGVVPICPRTTMARKGENKGKTIYHPCCDKRAVGGATRHDRPRHEPGDAVVHREL